MDLRGEPQRPNSNREVDSNMGDVVRDKLASSIKKPLVQSPIEPKSEKSELESFIEPLEDIVKTGEIIDDNKAACIGLIYVFLLNPDANSAS